MAKERVGRKSERPDGHGRRCPECKGSGQVPGIVKVTNMGRGMGSEFGHCPTCDGIGWLPGSDHEGDPMDVAGDLEAARKLPGWAPVRLPKPLVEKIQS